MGSAVGPDLQLQGAPIQVDFNRQSYGVATVVNFKCKPNVVGMIAQNNHDLPIEISFRKLSNPNSQDTH